MSTYGPGTPPAFNSACKSRTIAAKLLWDATALL
jgi:hypothetical protein